MSDEKNKEPGVETGSDKNPEKLPQKEQFNSRDIEVGGDGGIQTTNFEQQYKLAQFYVKSQMLPRQYSTPEKVITGMQYARELGLKQLTALRQITVINGTPSIFGDLPLAMVRSSGKLVSIKEYRFDENQKEINLKNKNVMAKPIGASCIVQRKGESKKTFTFTIQDAQQANLLNKDVWKNYLKTMLKYRARSEALKDVFGDVLAGISIAEYDYNDLPRDQRGPISPEAEVTEVRDDKITEDKLKAIKSMNINMDTMGLNEAQRIKYISQYLKCEDPFFATLENIVKLNTQLLIELEEGKGD